MIPRARAGTALRAPPGGYNPRMRRRLSGPPLALLVAAGALLGLALAGRAAAAQNPLGRAWRAAEAAGRYRFTGFTRAQVSVGEATYRLSGAAAVAGPISATVAVGAGSDLHYRIDWPAVQVAQATDDGPATRASPGTAAAPLDWVALDPHALSLVMPAGDPLALLATGHAPVSGGLEPVGDRDCLRVDFRVGADAYLPWWRLHPGTLPVNAEAGGLNKFTATATLWMDPASDLPCRLVARVALPRLAGEQAGAGEVDWRFSDWGAGEP